MRQQAKIFFLAFIALLLSRIALGEEKPIVMDLPEIEGIQSKTNSQLTLMRNPFNWGQNYFSRKRPLKKEALTLEAILWNEVRPMAVINSKLVMIGDAVADYIVMEIQEKKVVLSQPDGTERILKFEPLFFPVQPPNP